MPARILIINPKHDYKLATPPLGIGYILAYNRKVSNNLITFLDENVLENPNIELLRIIKEEKIDFVGISFPSSAIKRVLDICKFIRLHFGNKILIFAGGYHPTSEPELTLRLIPYLDFICIGEGEHIVSKLNDNWENLENIAYLKNNEFIQNKITYIKNIDEIPYPNRNDFNSIYFKPNHGAISGIYGRVATIMSSRGCPNQCNFCSSRTIQKTVRFHSVDYIMNEIDHIYSVVGKFDYLYFLDTMFNAKKSRVFDICDNIVKNGYHKRFKWAITATADKIDEEMIKALKSAGCFYISFGFESASNNVLRLMNKTAKEENNRYAMEICKKYSILANSAFLFGIPGEKIDDLEKTLNFVSKYNVFSTGINIMKPLPGSPYYYEFIKQGNIIPSIEDWYKVSSINVKGKIFNPEISEDTYNEYINKFYQIIYWKSRINNIRYNALKYIKYFFNTRLRND